MVGMRTEGVNKNHNAHIDQKTFVTRTGAADAQVLEEKTASVVLDVGKLNALGKQTRKKSKEFRYQLGVRVSTVRLATKLLDRCILQRAVYLEIVEESC